MSIKEITVPDIGSSNAVDVIEVHVAVGDSIKQEDALVTLESDKASMEIPSSDAGIVRSIVVKVGDKVKTGDLIITLETAQESAQAVSQPVASAAPAPAPAAVSAAAHSEAVHVPDIGSADKVDVIEISVTVGQTIEKNQTLIVLESEKASMEIPAPFKGVIESIAVKIGDKVGTQDLICNMRTADAASAPVQPVASAAPPSSVAPVAAVPAPVTPQTIPQGIYASPGVRRLARELDIDLTKIPATGDKGRITKIDLNAFIKNRIQTAPGAGLAVEAMPTIDFSQFGPIETQDLARIKKIGAKILHRNWVTIPHVTQFDEVDITDLEDFRQQNKGKAEARGIKLTPLVFLMKAAVSALKEFPTFNASLAANGEQLILKQFFHIGVAVDTPQGLVVPVVRNVDKKGFMELAQELKDISAKARDGQLSAKEMQGSSFTISSLGGIGGTAFTPIINAPDVAILGVSKSRIAPVYKDGAFIPRLMLPLSLSYDHRVIDGAQAAHFVTYLGELLGDMRQLLL